MEAQKTSPSPYLTLPVRSEAEYRRQMVANLRAEGCDDAHVARLTDDKTVRSMYEHEQRVCAQIIQMFQPGAGGIK